MTRWVVRFGALAIGLIAGALVVWGTRPRPGVHAEVAPPPGEVRWLKGQLHAHSSGSGDSWTDPEEVARFYAERGYDFVVITDHNRITRVRGRRDILVLPGVELTINLRRCEPPPEPGLFCLLHVNALLVEHDALAAADFPPQTASRAELYAASLALAQKMGAVAQLNHPNMHYGAPAELISALSAQGLALLEVANVSGDSNNAGDAAHPSTERLWDQVLTAGATVFATATDDAHHYWDAAEARARGEEVFGGGEAFVMVRARNEAQAIREALRRGDFYASTGPILTEHRVESGVWHLATDHPGATVAFIGEGGEVLHQVSQPAARLRLSEVKSRYVRAVISTPEGRRAWTQPLGL